MKITYATKRQEVTSEFVASAERKLKKFDRFFKDDASALIKTDKKKNGESVELTMSCCGTLYRYEKRSYTMMNEIDETIEAILRQIRKNKT
ncbi:MAG: HPF/RaiA family ribosome-associated protein, partial [Clostridia bacterium]|nr:HPF/RaiA family ribosome-associated protein [Clostridia bacterium]